MIGILPASGKAERLKGIPKFAIPTMNNETLIQRHVRMMRDHVDSIKICTTKDWFRLIETLCPDIELIELESSTMSHAVKVLGTSDSIIGMPDTFYKGENPYKELSKINDDIGLALWKCPTNLRGRVGQINIKDNKIINMSDKNPMCDYPFVWGAMKLSKDAINSLDPNTSHPGICLPNLIDKFSHSTCVIDGEYIDCGTPEGIRDMLMSDSDMI
jgi:hypothetical protein